jgi:cytochrome c-type biogenesis protein CcmF
MKYRETPPGVFWKKISVSVIVAAVISAFAAWQLEFDRVHYILLLFASIFTVTANTDYLFRVLKGNMSFSGGSIAHAGFGLILLGALISNGKSHVISRNLLNVDLGKEFPNNENIMLVKNDTLQMSNYFITYKGFEKRGVNVFYQIEYLKPDFEKCTFNTAFTLEPTVQLNPRMGNVSEPATQRFFDKDIYTHVTYADLESLERKETSGDYLEPVVKEIKTGDTITTSNSLITFTGLSQDLDRAALGLGPDDIAVMAVLEITDINKKKYTLTPLFQVRNRTVFSKEENLEPLGLKISFTKIDPETGKISLAIAEKKDNKREFIIMKAIVFPWINILWTGCILLVIGTGTAIAQRIRENKRRLQETD